MSSVGIFSGTFDPFHRAHLEACLVAKEACNLNSTVVVLEHKPQRKQKVTAYNHRQQMIDLAIQNYPSIRLQEAPVDNITFDTPVAANLTKQFGGAE
jgi:cytidyltransferase-like protein